MAQQMKVKKKKKSYYQEEIKQWYDVRWKFISGEGHVPEKGVTRMSAATAEEAEMVWLINHNYAQRKFKILSVTEVVTDQPNQEHEHETKPSKRVGTSKEHGEWDDIPDF